MIDAEIVLFPESLIPSLQELLYAYIAEFGDGHEPAVRIAVGSAIRKYVAILKVDDFRNVTVLLNPPNNRPLAIQSEIEIAKMIVRKLTAVPPAEADVEPNLSESLSQLVSKYLDNFHIEERKYPAVVLNAILAIVMLRGIAEQHLLDKLAALDARWFNELLVQRAGLIKAALTEKFGTGANLPALKGLDSLTTNLFVPPH